MATEVRAAVVGSDGLATLTAATRSRDLALLRRAQTRHDPVGALRRHAAASVPAYATCDDVFPVVQRAALGSRRHWSNAFDEDSVVVRTTSGTTGHALAVPRDPVSDYEFVYGTYAVVFDRLPALARPKAGYTAVLQVNDNPLRRASVLVNPELGHGLVKHAVLQGDWSWDQQISVDAAAARPQLVSGRPRALVSLVELCQRAGVALRPQVVLTTGDNLYDDVRALLEGALQAPVCNGYSSQEAGLIALECPHSAGLVTVPGIHLEQAPPSPETEAAPSAIAAPGRLIITSAHNYALPIVRYDTADLARIESAGCGCGDQRVLELAGRDSPWFEVAGRRLNPSVLNPAFEALPIRQFQVVQDADGAFDVLVVAPPSLDEAGRAHVRTAIAETFARWGASTVSVSLVETIGAAEEKVQRYVRHR